MDSKKNRLTRCMRLLAGIMFGAVLCSPSSAHEFWVMPDTFVTPTDVPVNLNLYVGQYFDGELVPLSGQYVAQFRHFSLQGKEDLQRRVPAVSAGGMPLLLSGAGTHLLAVDTHPNSVKLSADQFHYYLIDEGLEPILALRKAAGQSAAPSRERYRRHIKTLISVDGKSDDTALQRTGQRLELVPTSDPAAGHAGETLNFKLLFDDKPLAGALVKAWHKKDGQTMLIRVRSDANGITRVALPVAGRWMLSVVHMLPVQNDPDYDWESFWGNLTFQLDISAEK